MNPLGSWAAPVRRPARGRQANRLSARAGTGAVPRPVEEGIEPATSAFPADVVRDVVYACSGPRVGGVGFSFRLTFRDETWRPASPGWFDHGWTISREELERAEERRAVDQLILETRARELRRFLGIVERNLTRGGAVLLRARRGLVLRLVKT